LPTRNQEKHTSRWPGIGKKGRSVKKKSPEAVGSAIAALTPNPKLWKRPNLPIEDQGKRFKRRGTKGFRGLALGVLISPPQR